MKGLQSALLACSLLVPGLASAKTVVLTPLVGTDVKMIANVGSLISSELDFMSDVEAVVELPKAPASLNASCLASSSCLAGITKSNGGDQLVTGALTVAGAQVKLDLVLFDVATNKTVRRKAFTLPNSPTDIADGMGPVMREMMTGVNPTKSAAAEPTPDDFAAFAEEEDDFEFELEDAVDPDEERRAAEEAARQKAAADARKKAEAEAARQKAAEDARRQAEAEAARKRADEEARIAAEAEAAARKRADEEARRKAAAEEARRAAATAAAEEEDEEFDPSAISFGSAASEITQEEIEDTIQFAPSKPSGGSSTSASSSSKPASSSASRSRYDEEEPEEDFEEELDLAALDEEDDERSAGSRSRSASSFDDDDDDEREGSRSRTSSAASSRASLDREPGGGGEYEPASFQITVRGGYSKYYSFDFLTAGVEVGVNVADKVYLLAGVDTYSVQRNIPPALQKDGQATEWNTIYPLNGGVVYKLGEGAVHPYLGADLILAPYYIHEGGTSWAVGGRGRGGVDVMVADMFGFNLNVAVGYWSGKDWAIIQREIETSGLVPQVNAGTVFAF